MVKKNIGISYLQNFERQMRIADEYMEKYQEGIGYSYNARYLIEARMAISGACGRRAVPEILKGSLRLRTGRLDRIQDLLISLKYGSTDRNPENVKSKEILMSA